MTNDPTPCIEFALIHIAPDIGDNEVVTVITSDLLQRRYTEHTIPYYRQVCVICIVVSVTVCVFSTHAMTGHYCCIDILSKS